MIAQENKVESLSHTFLTVAVAAALVDVFVIRDLIVRVFFDTSDFIAYLMWVYLFLIAYAILHLTTGTRLGSWLVLKVTGYTTEVLTINGMMLAVFYFMGQGPDVIGFLLNTLIGFSIPFGLLSYAITYALNHSSNQEKTAEVGNMSVPEAHYVKVDSAKMQNYSMMI